MGFYKNFLCRKSFEHLANSAGVDENANANRIVKVVFTDILSWCYFFRNILYFYFCFPWIIATPQGVFIVPYVWDILVRKNQRVFFTKGFSSNSCFFNLVKPGIISPTAIQMMEAVIRGLSEYFVTTKCFVS